MDYALNLVLRTTLVAAVAGVGVRWLRSAAARHAVWTVVMAGMLAQAVLGPLLPALPLRVLTPVSIATATSDMGPAPVATAVLPAPPARRSLPGWAMVYGAGVLLLATRLGVALWITRRLVRNAVKIGEGRFESSAIAVPMTVGSRTVLPAGWRDWDSVKLAAVLAHEEAHVGRRDWAIALLAQVNRTILWFHPLAWWIESELARLAEQSCDDEAVRTVGDRQQYASVLLEMARTVRGSKGRLLTTGMAKEANVETRINRILDGTRRMPKAFGRRGWAALIVCGAPLMYMAAAATLAPAQTVLPARPPAPPPAPSLLAQTPLPAPPPAPALAPAPLAAPRPPQPPEPPPAAPAPLPAPPPPPPAAPPPSADSFSLTLEESARTVLDLETKLAVMEQTLARAQALASRQKNSVSSQQLLDQAKQLGFQIQQLRQQSGEAGSSLSVIVSPERNVTLRFPLGERAEYDLTAQVLDQSGHPVANARDRMNGSSWTGHFSLKTGRYTLHVISKRTADGVTSAQDFPFNVR